MANTMTGKLKASTNRVRTSLAHNTHSIWTNAVGLEQSGGQNQAVEAALHAPTMGGGRAARRAAAAAAVEQTGGFNSAVEDYAALLELARNQGAIGGQNRGACRICGQLGHLTKQQQGQAERPALHLMLTTIELDNKDAAMMNHLSAHFKRPTNLAEAQELASSGKPLLPSVPADPRAGSGSDISSLSDSDSETESSSSAERRERRKRKHHTTSGSKRKHSKVSKEKSSKDKSKGKHKKKSSKHRSHKRRRRSSSGSPSD